MVDKWKIAHHDIQNWSNLFIWKEKNLKSPKKLVDGQIIGAFTGSGEIKEGMPGGSINNGTVLTRIRDYSVGKGLETEKKWADNEKTQLLTKST